MSTMLDMPGAVRGLTAIAGALQLSGFPQPRQLPLNLTKLVMRPVDRGFCRVKTLQQNISNCICSLKKLHQARFDAAGSLPNLKSLRMVGSSCKMPSYFLNLSGCVFENCARSWCYEGAAMTAACKWCARVTSAFCFTAHLTRNPCR
jgi:hypothetical protein